MMSEAFYCQVTEPGVQLKLTLSLLAVNVICSADQNSILAIFVYHTTINSVRSWKLYFDQVATSNISSESYFYKDFNGFNPIKIS